MTISRGAIVLCGGRSTRMGRDKATLPFGDEVLLQRIVRVVRSVAEDVVVVAARDQVLPSLPDDVRVVHDEVEAKGPLGGLAAGLDAGRAELVFATGCDVPFIAAAFIELLFTQIGDADVAVAETDGFVHPLAAVYRRGVETEVRRLLDAERLRPVFLYDAVPTVRVPEAVLRTADPELRSLENVNTPEAYERALARLESEA